MITQSIRARLAAIIAVSVVVRVGSAFIQGDTVEALPGIHDQISYDLLARRLLGGFGFSFAEPHWPANAAGAPTAHWSYLYTLFLSAVYAVSGGHALVARILQAVAVGVLQPLLIWRLADRAFGSNVALVAAAIAGIYGYFAYYGGALMTESFFIVALLWTLDRAALLAAGSQPSRRGWAMLGLAATTTLLLRQVFGLFIPFLILWVLLTTRRPGETAPALIRRQASGLAVCALVALSLIAPWTARNYSAFGEFALLNTSAGFAFFWGNHPVHGDQFQPILSGKDAYGKLIPASVMGLNEVQMERDLMRRAVGFVVADPGRYLRLSAGRAVEYFKFWPSRDSSLLSNCVRVASFGLLLPLALLGVLLQGNPAQRQVGGDLALRNLFLLFVVVYTAVHLLTWTLIRYRLPVDAVIIPFAANGAFAVWRIVSKLLPSGRLFTPTAT